MPLGSAIGSHQGLQCIENLKIIIENARVPIIVDAGIGKPSDASIACELGADAVLMNSVIAESTKPELMAIAMKYAVRAGRLGFLAKKEEGSSKEKKAVLSSPKEGLFF
jgi:thiazole synthase